MDGWMGSWTIDLCYPQEFCEVGLSSHFIYEETTAQSGELTGTQSQEQVIEQDGGEWITTLVYQIPKTLSRALSFDGSPSGPILSLLASHSTEFLYKA